MGQYQWGLLIQIWVIYQTFILNQYTYMVNNLRPNYQYTYMVNNLRPNYWWWSLHIFLHHGHLPTWQKSDHQTLPGTNKWKTWQQKLTEPSASSEELSPHPSYCGLHFSSQHCFVSFNHSLSIFPDMGPSNPKNALNGKTLNQVLHVCQDADWCTV